MPRLAELRPGLGLWVEHHGKHPAVVLKVDATAAYMICGTSRHRPETTHVCLTPGSPGGRALGLSGPTYFYPSGVAVIVDASAIMRIAGQCPPRVFRDLEAIAVLAGRITVAAAQPAQDPSDAEAATAHTSATSTPSDQGNNEDQ